MLLNYPFMNKLAGTSLRRAIPVFAVGVLAVVAMATNGAATAQEYKKITRLGTSQSVCPGGVETAADLQAYFAENPDAIRSILADSGWSGDADALLAAVANGEMTEASYPVGTKLAWMGSKKDGQFVALPYREWAGKQSFSGFSVNLRSDCKVYEMAIPKACCNVSLVSVSDDNSTECAPQPVAAPAPAVAPVSEVADEPLLASTADPLALIPFLGVFAGTETIPRIETAWQKDIKDSSGLIGLKAGLIKQLSAKTSLAGTLSYYDRNGINDGNFYPEDNFAVDLGLERRLSERAFIAGGLGAWNVDDSDFREASLYGMVGGDLGESNMQWFLEGRVFDTDSMLDSLSDNKMFSVGIRYLIK